MSKGAWVVGIIIVLVLIAGAFYFMKDNSGVVTDQINSATDNSALSEENQDSAEVGTVNQNSGTGNINTEATQYAIDIVNFAFSPSTLTIKAGDSVTWTNKDSSSHTVTSDSGNELDSERISNGQTYMHVFTQLGTYKYHCTPHPGMKATIVVTS